MAVSATRFNFLSRDTSIPIKDFTSFNDNAVYNVLTKVIESGVSDNQQNDEVLKMLHGDINNLTILLNNNIVTDSINDAMNSVMDVIENMNLPALVKDIFNFIKSLDDNAFISFLKETLKLGSFLICNYSELLKLFNINVKLNLNILSGLILISALNWIDTSCNQYSKKEMKEAKKEDVIEMMFPSKGVNVTPDKAFVQFTNLSSGLVKINKPIPVTVPLDKTTFLNNVVTGDITSSIDNLRNSEISSLEKKEYLNVLNTNLVTQPIGSVGYKNILLAKGKLINTPLISAERRDKNIQYENLHNNLSSYAKNLSDVTLLNPNFSSLSAIEQSLYNKMIILKNASTNSRELQSTPNSSFKNFDIASFMPTLTAEEEAYLLTKENDDSIYRRNDLHPTTEVFIQEVVKCV